MDLRQLKSLIYIADCGSLSRAAEMLRTSQPSLSQHIKHLETELGVELLHRHPRGVTLTELGHTFCADARAIVKDVERAKETIVSRSQSPSGKVSIGFPTSACRGISAHLIRAVETRYPTISLHILEAMTGTLDEWVQLGRLDVALLYDHKAFANISLHEVAAEDLMLMAHPDNAILRRKNVPFAEFENLPIVLPGKQHALRNLIERLAARASITLNVVIESDSLSAIISLVRAGYMTIMPHFAMLDEIHRGEIATIEIVDPTPSWRLSAVVSQRSINGQSSEAVAQVLVELIRSMIRAGTWKARLGRELG